MWQSSPVSSLLRLPPEAVDSVSHEKPVEHIRQSGQKRMRTDDAAVTDASLPVDEVVAGDSEEEDDGSDEEEVQEEPDVEFEKAALLGWGTYGVKAPGGAGLQLRRLDERRMRYLDSAVAGWRGWAEDHPGRDWVLCGELIGYVVEHWSRFSQAPPQHKLVRSMLRRAIFGGRCVGPTPFYLVKRPHKDSSRVSIGRGFAERANVCEMAPRDGEEGLSADGRDAILDETAVFQMPDRDAILGSPAEFGMPGGEGWTIDARAAEEINVWTPVGNRLPVARCPVSPLVAEHWLSPPPGPVRLSLFDRAPGLAVSASDYGGAEMVRGFSGFRSVRASHGVFEGSWYFEVFVLPWEGDGAVRIGWSNRRADIETPVGCDENGFGIRDRSGEFVHASLLSEYCEAFSTGDVIGCLIRLPASLPSSTQARVADENVEFLNHRHTYGRGASPPATGSGDFEDSACVEFFKNGVFFGKPPEFRKMHRRDRVRMQISSYYPTISLFKNAEVRVNFGPFECMPAGCRAISDLAFS